MTTFEIITTYLFALLLGIVLGVVIAFELLKQSDEIEEDIKDEWGGGDY